MNDRAQLHKEINRVLDAQLAEGESVRVVIAWYGVMVGTDRRVFVFQYNDKFHPLTPKLVGTFSYTMLSGVTMSMEGFYGHVELAGSDLGSSMLAGGSHESWISASSIGIQRTLRGDRARAIEDGFAELRRLIEEAHRTKAQAPTSNDIVSQIRALADLRDQGIITAAEFEAKKTELLARI